MQIKESLQRIGYFICGLVLLGGILNARISEAATFYVAMPPAGDNNNPGTQDKPWATLQKAMNASGENDTILVRAGTYAGFALIDAGGGSEGKPKTIRAHPGEQVTLDGNLTASSSGGRPVIYFEGPGASYVTVDGFKITDTGGTHPGYAPPWTPAGGTDYNLCKVWLDYTSGKLGIRFDWHSTDEPSNTPRGIIIQSNEIYNLQSGGILGVARNVQLLNNHIHHNGRWAQEWYGGGYGTYFNGDGHLIRGNIVHHNNSVGLRFACQGRSTCPLTNSIIENNLIYENFGRVAHPDPPTRTCDADSGGYGLVIFGGTGNTIRNNIIYGNFLNEKWGERQGQWGIHLHPWAGGGAGPNHIYNNTIFNHQGPNAKGIDIVPVSNGWGAIKGNGFRNNIVYQNGIDLQLGDPGDNPNSNNLTSDPKFANTDPLKGDFDFHLQEGSLAIDAGFQLSEVPVDYSGVARPTGAGYDIGAYEYLRRNLVPPGNLRIVSQ